jgi:hypothetical protein
VNNIAARRYGEMACYMAKYGWEPFVLTTKNSGDLNIEIPEANIIRIGGHHQKGLIVESPGAEGLPRFLRFVYLLYKKLNLNFKSMDRFIFSLPGSVFKELDRIKKIEPDVILASYGPATSLWLGNLLSWQIKKPWVADFRDSSSLTNYSVLGVLDKCVDRILLNSSSGIVTVSPSLAYLLSGFYNKRAMVVFNGFKEKGALNDNSRNKPVKNGEKVIYYAGRFNLQQLNSVRLLINWLSKCGRNDIVFNIRSLGTRELNILISNYAKELGVSRMINILEPAEDKIIQRESEEADILTVFVDYDEHSPAAAGTITGKLLKLLPLGAPVLVIGRKDSDVGKILNETRTGYLVSNAAQLDIFMERALGGSLTLRPVWDEIRKYSSQNQCGRLCFFLDKIVAKP